MKFNLLLSIYHRVNICSLKNKPIESFIYFERSFQNLFRISGMEIEYIDCNFKRTVGSNERIMKIDAQNILRDDNLHHLGLISFT